jgi:hypothetical protein
MTGERTVREPPRSRRSPATQAPTERSEPREPRTRPLSGPPALIEQPASGGNERGGWLDEGGRRKHCRPRERRSLEPPPSLTSRGFLAGNRLPLSDQSGLTRLQNMYICGRQRGDRLPTRMSSLEIWVWGFATAGWMLDWATTVWPNEELPEKNPYVVNLFGEHPRPLPFGLAKLAGLGLIGLLYLFAEHLFQSYSYLPSVYHGLNTALLIPGVVAILGLYAFVHNTRLHLQT